MAHTLIIYAVKVSVALAVFYGLYLLCMRNDTFLKLRRLYFLFAMLFSVGYPLFSIELPTGNESAVELPAYWISDLETLYTIQPAMQESTMDIVLFVVLSVFLLGSAVMAAKFVVQLYSVVRLIIRNRTEAEAAFRVVSVGKAKIHPFSFFGWIFIGTDKANAKELSEILCHEKVHARQLHSFDVLLSHILCIGFWWNPIVWLMRRDVKANLEYLADEGALNMGIDAKLYQYALLNLSIENTDIPIINNFNVSQLKKRIVMMNKNKSPWLLSAKYLLVVPIGAALILGNAIQASPDSIELLSNVITANNAPGTDGVSGATDQPQQADKKKDAPPRSKDGIFMSVEQMPQFPGGQAELMNFIGRNLKYPVKAQEDNVQGRVIVRFVVDKDGSVKDAVIQRGLSPETDAEALRVVNDMPKWTPGKENGKAVPVYFTLPIQFKLQSNKAVGTQTGATDANADKPLTSVEQMPQFPGGQAGLVNFISANLKYPEKAQEDNVQGRVIVRFIVDKDGSVKDAVIQRGLSPETDAEALRVVNAMPKWTPGKQNGKAVPVYFTLPIQFKIPKNND
ncbi:MAG: M56 family metallopeptidase [Prevotella sp.]|jgi:TonB family protein|nr:M56 family metallopeptidase [Prevotella sp.]